MYKFCMANDSEAYIPFSQRNGLAPIPSQLKIGEISSNLRRCIDYYVDLEIERNTNHGYDSSSFTEKWRRVAMDVHVLFFNKEIKSFENSPWKFKNYVNTICMRGGIGMVFDFVEFLIRHPGCSPQIKSDLNSAFIATRSAYRIFDDQCIAAIGTHEQAAAFEKAVMDAEANGAGATRTHLIEAGRSLRDADWAGSVRESIHAVEAIALKLAPDANTLGPALNVLEDRGRLHGSLKEAFKKLYGYSSDEEGVRHALVFQSEAQVDEADALFMLGACASFVSYLLARAGASASTAGN